MRLIVLPLLAAAVAANLPSSEPAPPERSQCRDRISQVREAAGQPRLDRSPARPGDGFLIAAVDKRVDGCAVMQMHRNIDDLRPVPEPSMGPARLQPAR